MPEFLYEKSVLGSNGYVKYVPPLLDIGRKFKLTFNGDGPIEYLNLNARVHIDVVQEATGGLLGRLTLGEMNGQCGILVLSYTDFCAKEYLPIIYPEAVKIARTLRFPSLLGSGKKGMQGSKFLASLPGWRKIHEFQGRSNIIEMFMGTLQETGIEAPKMVRATDAL